VSAHGFVLQYTLADADDAQATPDSRCRLIVRPLATTPEAVRERQPIVTPRAILVYAGRIDNRREIADRLGRPRLATATDGELFAEAYAAWDDRFPANVLGEYSVALVDRASGRLVAARDSLGIGRLFRYDDAGAVWVASSLELLLDALPARPPFDRRSLAEYFAGGGLLTSGRTIYEGIRELPAAHVLTQRGAAVSVQRYWQPDPERRLALRSAGDYDEAFRSVLFEAIRAAMRSSTRVWSDLSGGLDSSTVTAVAALLDQAGKGPVAGLGTFSLIMSQTASSDESEFQREFLAAYPLEHRTVDADRHLCFGSDEPPSCHPSKAILYRPVWDAAATLFAAEGVTTHLTGRGGDPIFCGDDFPPLYLAELARAWAWPRWFDETRQWARLGQRSFWNLLWHCSRGNLTDLYAGAQKGRVPSWLAPGFVGQVRAVESEPWCTGPRLYASPARELQYRSIVQTSAVVRFIRVGDERHPLLYRPLVEFVLALPWEHTLRPDQNRVIQRRALRGILPESIRLRTSKASGTHVLLRGLRENWPKVQTLTLGRRLAALDLVEPSAFQAACERLRHGLLGDQLRYFAAALSLEIWLRANEAHRPAARLVPLPGVGRFEQREALSRR
jgi:asparagine synthase (glutamine-hydrolysing)